MNNKKWNELSFKEKAIIANRNYKETSDYLKELNMHLCEHGIFTDGIHGHYVGSIGKDFSINSIMWR